MTEFERPTDQAYQQLQKAYDFYNDRLFDGVLPHCLFTFHRNPKSAGYFSPARFSSKSGQKTDEIAMNIAYFAISPIEEVLSTLAHEMAHLKQEHFGIPGKKGYHNSEWATIMDEIGLIPTSTGLPGGKRVGEKMDHYIEPGGKFELATDELLDAFFELSWYDRYVATKPENMRRQISRLSESGVDPHLSQLPADEFMHQLDLCIPGDSMPPDLIKKLPKKKKTPTSPVAQVLKGSSDDEGKPKKFKYAGYSDDESIEDEPAPQMVPMNKSNRMTYVCPACQLKVWGKPKIRIKCMDCSVKMKEAD